MAHPLDPPQMEPSKLKIGPGWCVVVTWADGQTEQVNEFHSERDAEIWIETRSLDWEKARRKTKKAE